LLWLLWLVGFWSCCLRVAALPPRRMRVNERPEFAEPPETLAPLHPWGEAIAGAGPDERFGGVAGHAEGTQAGQEIPVRGEGLLAELAGVVERVQGIHWAAGKEDGAGKVDSHLGEL